MTDHNDARATCGSCLWWRFGYRYDTAGDRIVGLGECRVRSPIVGATTRQWPETIGEDWCGEHKLREAGDDE